MWLTPPKIGGGVEHKEISLLPDEEKISCKTIDDIENCIKKCLEKVDFSSIALMLSGGIDSGILASYMPQGTKAYTVANASKVSDLEVKRAAEICDRCGLEHIVVEVTWQDYQECIDDLMTHDGCPVFANEPQVYAIAQKIKNDGHNCIIIGDNADMAFGGMDRMLSKDWTFDEWVERYTFVDPERVLKNPSDILGIYEKYRIDETKVDFIKFIQEVFAISSSGAYVNAFDTVGIDYIDPYAVMKMEEPLDLKRIRNGESKYMLRELYMRRFPDMEAPEKIAMARATDVWLKDWKGPEREEFISECIDGLTGEQKFLVYSLERFLNIMNL